ncbi:8-amino-7-oxononanoate synthase [Phascolarctobacterium sp.]|uniref:8-amino-7-oxononanoate synthase n=1 Tax=Phascolarctobacterium sp. TaxID=2049039 RepID=UPI0030785A15
MLETRLQEELQQIRRQGLERKITDLHFLDPTQALDREGKKYLVLSSNNYLGLTHAQEVIAASRQAAASFGAGSTGSRLTTGGTFAASDLEKRLARFKHSESALVFNTGYMTNLGVLYGLLRAGDVVFSDELNHASIIDGCRISRCKTVVYKHNDMADLQRLLESEPVAGQRFIVTDGVFSMDGDIADLPTLVKLKERFDACLIVDDAHGVGVIGSDGSGTAAHYGLLGKIDLQIGTLSKALASEGGYVAGKKIIIDYLINRSRPFIFSTALSPAALAAADATLQLLETQPQKYLGVLWENSGLLRRLLSEEGLQVINGVTPIIPVMVGEAELTMKFAAGLREAGILVAGIRPPTVPQGESRLRVTVTAAHSESQLRQAAKVIGSVWRGLQGRC